MSKAPVDMKRYAIPAGVCLAAAVALFFGRYDAYAYETNAVARFAMAACDALFVPGAFCLMIGLLMWVASEGALDGVSYLGTYLTKTLIPGKRSTIERYGEYVERKRGKRKKGFGHLCVVGLVFLVLSVAALLVYRSIV